MEQSKGDRKPASWEGPVQMEQPLRASPSCDTWAKSWCSERGHHDSIWGKAFQRGQEGKAPQAGSVPGSGNANRRSSTPPNPHLSPFVFLMWLPWSHWLKVLSIGHVWVGTPSTHTQPSWYASKTVKKSSQGEALCGKTIPASWLCDVVKDDWVSRPDHRTQLTSKVDGMWGLCNGTQWKTTLLAVDNTMFYIPFQLRQSIILTYKRRKGKTHYLY